MTDSSLSLAAVAAALRASWSYETCDPDDQPEWSPANPARGQCGVSALVVTDLLGGALLEAEVFEVGARTGHHYWNRLPSRLDIDLTREQFRVSETLTEPREVQPQRPGPVHLAAYQLLAERVRARLGPSAAAAGRLCADTPEAARLRRVSDQLSGDELEFLQSAFELARAGQTETLAAYVDAGLPVNLTNAGGDTLLILAAYHQHESTVRALLARGADTARVNDKGQTALAAAVFRQSREIVSALLEAGADPALGPKSAIEIARFFELQEMLTLLTSG